MPYHSLPQSPWLPSWDLRPAELRSLVWSLLLVQQLAGVLPPAISTRLRVGNKASDCPVHGAEGKVTEWNKGKTYSSCVYGCVWGCTCVCMQMLMCSGTCGCIQRSNSGDSTQASLKGQVLVREGCKSCDLNTRQPINLTLSI